MASRRGKRKYTSREVAEMIANDSDSEGLNAEYDSDMLIEDSDSDSSQQTANILPETPGNSSVYSQSGVCFVGFVPCYSLLRNVVQ